MYNLGTVIRFEVIRTLKKKSFWLMVLLFPIITAGIFAIVYFSNQSTSQAEEALKKQQFSVVITDKSKLVSPQLIQAIGAKTADDKQSAIDQVKSGKVDGYIYYPENIKEQPVEVYGRNVGIFDNGRYEVAAGELLRQSVRQRVDSNIYSVVEGKFDNKLTIFRDGKVYEPFKEMVLPGMFLVLFYMLIAFFGNQMLTSTTEEKENRVIEMLLTTIEARTLIVGKIISLIGLAMLQAVLLTLPPLIGYWLLRDSLDLPTIDLSSLPVDWVRIGLGALIMMVSLGLFTGLLVMIGAMLPTAKEAGSFLAVIMMLIFGPLYALSLFISMPDAGIVRFLTLFPLTAPIPMLLRNALGNLHDWEVWLGLLIMIISTVVVMGLAVRVFRYGAIEYSRKLSLKELFKSQA